MAGFLARQRYMNGDEVLILVGAHAGESGQVAAVYFGGSEQLARYKVADPDYPEAALGVFESGHLRGLADGALARGLLRPSGNGLLSLDKVLTQIEALIPPEWDFDLSRLGTNEGELRYRAYAGDPRDGGSDLTIYGASRGQVARRMRDALQNRFGPTD